MTFLPFFFCGNLVNDDDLSTYHDLSIPLSLFIQVPSLSIFFFQKWDILIIQKPQKTHMDHVKHSFGNPAILLLFFVGFLCLCVWSFSYITNPFSVFRKESLSTQSNTVSFNFQAYSFIYFTNMHMGCLNFVQKTQESFNSYRPTYVFLKMTLKKLYPKLQWQTKRS